MCAAVEHDARAAQLEAARDGVERRRAAAAEVRHDGAHQRAEAAALGDERSEAEPLERVRR